MYSHRPSLLILIGSGLLIAISLSSSGRSARFGKSTGAKPLARRTGVRCGFDLARIHIFESIQFPYEKVPLATR